MAHHKNKKGDRDAPFLQKKERIYQKHVDAEIHRVPNPRTKENPTVMHRSTTPNADRSRSEQNVSQDSRKSYDQRKREVDSRNADRRNYQQQHREDPVTGRLPVFTRHMREYSVAEFYNQFQNKLPQLVVVTQEFLGDAFCDQPLGKNYLLLINALACQTRIMANCQTTNGHRLISLPEIFPEKLCVIENSTHGTEIDLPDILRHYQLPVSVCFPKDKQLEVKGQAFTVYSLQLFYAFGEISLLGNIVFIGSLRDGSKWYQPTLGPIVAIPLFLSQLRLSVVTGIASESGSVWATFCQQIKSKTFEFEYDLLYGIREITEYPPDAMKSKVPCSCISPTAIINMKSSAIPLIGTRQERQVQYPRDNIHTSRNDVDRFRDYLKDDVKPPLPGRNVTGGLKSSIPKGDTDVRPNRDRQPPANDLSQELEAQMGKMRLRMPDDVTITDHGNRLRQSRHADELPVHQSNQIITGQKCISADEENAEISKTKKYPSAEKKTIPDYLTPKFTSDDVARLSIREVGKFLEKLKLEKYVKDFEKHKINGVLLVALDREILQEDFGMTGVEALRLLKFAGEGHLPTWDEYDF